MLNRTAHDRIRRSIIICSALGIFAIGVIVSLMSILPLYGRLKESVENNLNHAAKIRAIAVDEYLSRAKDITLQITSRTQIRKKLESYNRGEANLNELVRYTEDKLADAMKLSDEVAGISRLGPTGELLVEVGMSPPGRELWPIPPDNSKDAMIGGPISIGKETFLLVVAHIFGGKSIQVGTDVVLFKIDRLKRIVEDYRGLGKTGETILGIPKDDQVHLFFPLRESQSGVAGAISQASALGSAIEKSFRNEIGITSLEDSSGTPVIVAYSPVQEAGWGIVVKMGAEELYSPVDRQIVLIAIIILALILICTFGMVLLLRPLTGALQKELTERKQVEEELRASRELLDNIINSTPSYIFATDLQNRLILANNGLAQFFGIPKEEILGKTEHDFFPKSVAEELQATNKQIIETGTTLQIEESLASKVVGVTRTMITIKFPLRNAQGKIYGLCGVSTDITDRMQADKVLRQSAADLSRAQELAKIGNWSWDIAANKIKWSDEYYRIVGLDKEQFAANYDAYLSCIHPDDLKFFKSTTERVLKEKKPYSLEYRIVRHNNDIRVIHEIGEVAVDMNGNAVHLFGTAQDITERKRAEEELETRSHQQALVAELGQHALAGIKLGRLMDEAVTIVAKTLQVEYCKVLELLPEGNALVLRAGFGWKKGSVGQATVPAGLDSQAGYTLDSSAPVIVGDLRNEQRFSGPPLLHEHGVVSGISVIIGKQDHPYGVLGAHTNQRRKFSPDDIHFLQAVGNVLGEAIERKRVEEVLRNSEKYLQKQNEVLVELAKSRSLARGDLKSTLKEITEASVNMLEIERVNVWLYNKERSKIFCLDMYERTPNRHSKGQELTAADYPSYFKGLEEERTIAAHDAHTDPRTKEFSENYLSLYGISSMLDAPIRMGGQVIGVLCYENVGPARHWTLEEENFSGSMADLVSLAIEAQERKRAEEVLRKSEAALRNSQKDLRFLAGHLLSAQEEERRRLAHELHDHLAQRLAVLAIEAGKLEQQMQSSPAPVLKKLHEIKEQVVELSTDVHRISRQLHPSILDDLGLVYAIESECTRFAECEGIPIKFTPEKVPESLPKDISLCLYRISQESLRNIAKHAQAKEAHVTLTGLVDGILLSIQDAGVGFDPARTQRRGGLGLASIEERVRLIGGNLSVQSQPGRGTVIKVYAPLDRSDA